MFNFRKADGSNVPAESIFNDMIQAEDLERRNAAIAVAKLAHNHLLFANFLAPYSNDKWEKTIEILEEYEEPRNQIFVVADAAGQLSQKLRLFLSERQVAAEEHAQHAFGGARGVAAPHHYHAQAHANEMAANQQRRPVVHGPAVHGLVAVVAPGELRHAPAQVNEAATNQQETTRASSPAPRPGEDNLSYDA